MPTTRGGFLGLDYAGVEAAARLSGIAVTPTLFAEVQLMEAEAIKALAER